MPDVATHITYKQAEAILGPYLDSYLKADPGAGQAGSHSGRSSHLSQGGGFYENEFGTVVYGEDVISIESVKKMADYLHSSGYAYFQQNPSHQAPDWPKETRHYQKPKAQLEKQ